MPFKSLLYVTDCPHTYINAFFKAFVTENRKKFLKRENNVKKRTADTIAPTVFSLFPERCVHRRGVCESVLVEASGGIFRHFTGGNNEDIYECFSLV